MNRIFTLFLGLLILSLQACTNNQTNTQPQYPTRTKTDLEKMGLHGKVKSLNIKSYSLDPKTGETYETLDWFLPLELLCRDFSLADLFHLHIQMTRISFNSSGYISSKLGEDMVFDYKYDGDNQIKLIDNIDSKIKFNYDKDKLISSIERIAEEGESLYLNIRHEYDEQGRPREQLAYESKSDSIIFGIKYQYMDKRVDKRAIIGKKRIPITLEYGENKELIQATIGLEGGQSYTFFFNKQQLPSRMILNKNEDEFTMPIDYSFDERGNWVKRTIKFYGKPYFVTERKISYY